MSIELLTKAGREKGIVNSLEPLESRANPYRLSTHTTPPNLLVSHGFYLSGSQNLQIRLKFAKMNTKESSGTRSGYLRRTAATFRTTPTPKTTPE